jgi:IclR family KDG regulon transcriptional repressor
LPVDFKVRSVMRALKCLIYLSEHQDGVALAVIARDLRIPKTTAYYILETLVAEDFTTKDSHGAYRLGTQAFRVGNAYKSQLHITDQFHEVAKEVVARTGETVQLGILEGTRVVYIAKEEGTQQVRLVSKVGSSLPAHTTALGKVLLAGIAPESLAVLYPPYTKLERLTEHSITSLELLTNQLETVRENGYAQDCEETSLDLQCFAAPVIGERGHVIAAISVSAPTNRVNAERCDLLISIIKKAAAQMSYLLGG